MLKADCLIHCTYIHHMLSYSILIIHLLQSIWMTMSHLKCVTVIALKSKISSQVSLQQMLTDLSELNIFGFIFL